MSMTLTQTAKITKRFLLIFGILFVLLTVSYIGYQIYYYQYYLPHKPAPVIKPDKKFGPLPAPKFISTDVSSSNYSYSLATVTGGLPTDIPKIEKVYFIPQLGTTLLASDKATQLANSFSFTQGPTITNQTTYQFSDTQGGTMTIDLNTSNFTFNRIASPSGTLQENFTDQGQVADQFKAYLSNKGLLADDLSSGRTNVVFDNSLPQNSQTATISIWPADFNNLEIVTPTFSDGLIKAVVNTAKDETIKYQNLTYTYWSPDSQNSSTYPLKTPDQAFSDLKSGLGVVVVQPTDPQVAITSVKLAYYESGSYSLYLLPVYVFEGEGFVAYVDAIPSDITAK